jgi:hypothetical protein
MEELRYEYVGPPDILERVTGEEGFRVESLVDLGNFLSRRDSFELDEPFTYVVDVSGCLLLAPRRSEHVECSAGSPVLAAGEIGFRFGVSAGSWEASYVSNQSNGYCPDVSSWSALARALDGAGIIHGKFYTHPIDFRKCAYCGNWNVVKDEVLVCALCDRDLP